MGYKMKQIFSGALPGFKNSPTSGVQSGEVIQNEQYYLEQIKNEPKNFGNYDSLGKFYISQGSFSEARDVYLYLTGHQPANADFHARLAFCHYQSQNYRAAAESYKKSLALDSTQPSRYYNLGLCQQRAGNLAEAIAAYEKAIAIEPSPKYQKALNEARAKLASSVKTKEISVK
jgi:tetratricopeptide (TPR) repeat protein